MADNQRYFTLLTDKGRYKIAKAAADKGEVKFSHFAIGDGNGQETSPLPSATALVHEVWRGQLDSVTTDPKNPAAVVINAIIPHNVGGWWMREFGLFDIDGDMLAVVKPAPNYKATSAEGQLEDVFYEFQLVIGEQAQVVVLVDPSILWATREYVETRKIPGQQLANTPWLPVKALDVATPPATNSQGDTYVVPTLAKGEWKDKSGQLAEWNGKSWTYFQTPDGHGIGLPDGSVYVKSNGQYQLLRLLYQNWFDLRYSRLTAPPSDTFYVVGPSGSDKNSGLKPTPEDGFATIQGAINAIAGRYITQGAITIKISPGTYDGFSVDSSFVSGWAFWGVPDNSSAVRVIATDPTKQPLRGCVVNASVVASLHNMTLAGYYDCVVVGDGKMEIYDCNIEMSGMNHSYGVVCHSGNLSCFGKLRFYGKGIAAFTAANNGYLMLGYSDIGSRKTLDVYYNADVQVQNNFLLFNSGVVQFQPAAATFHGTPVGKNFSVESNSIINLIGSGPNALPGTQPGSCNTGGQIV